MKNRNGFSPSILDALTVGSLNDPLTLGLTATALKGKKIAWKFMRWIPSKRRFFRRTLGHYPSVTIANARQMAASLNQIVEAGADPRDVERDKKAHDEMTVDRAHHLYMAAVREGRHRKRPLRLRPITIKQKEWLYNKFLKGKIGGKFIYEWDLPPAGPAVITRVHRFDIRAVPPAQARRVGRFHFAGTPGALVPVFGSPGMRAV
ncbi:hypothetical protein Sphch_3707 [Sphingobium chlorophenolicum L-1]|uniref:Integrase DNA-binding domain-containing protein n=1 Tax=Sphingobium chlorophenolicum L-1 TaxID=690566 RepID=F6F174_SPHCR|nr:Arm DNA-binding domain-containing protein [Sphingobium chlorophenolicum]AEG51290.1 hypothetical protein Sphch_3707 [Sphingobium chlorophenolicum L-1]